MASEESSAGLSEEEHVAFQAATLESRPKLEQARTSSASSQWLQPCLNTEQGTSKVYELLEAHVQGEQFIDSLVTARQHADAQYWQASGVSMHMADVEQQWSHLTAVPDPTAHDITKDEELQEYVIVQREEVIDAMGAFIAAYLANLPEAKKMDPQQLQKALQSALKELRKGQVRRLWDWGKTLYRAAAVSYAAFSMYENPWLVMALLKAMWAAAKLLLGAMVI